MVMKKKILLIENSNTDFFKSRIQFAYFLVKNGYEVYALIPYGNKTDLKNNNIKIFNYVSDRNKKGITSIIKNIFLLKRIIKNNKIDIIHSFRFQPNLLNVLTNYFNKKILVLHITGLGIAFSNTSIYYQILQILSQLIFQIKLIRANKVIVQNPDDISDIYLNKFWGKKVHLVKGSGVDINIYNRNLYNKSNLKQKFNYLDSDIIFVCVTRLIWEKGILEMINAVKYINNVNIKLLIIGSPDLDNPRKITHQFITKYSDDENISFLGKKSNIIEFLAISDVFIYPSYYREGIPRAILEALSMSLPVITTNTPGCSLTVENGKNGILVKPKSVEDLIRAINEIIDTNKINEMGQYSRILAENEFENEIIFKQILQTYIS